MMLPVYEKFPVFSGVVVSKSSVLLQTSVELLNKAGGIRSAQPKLVVNQR